MLKHTRKTGILDVGRLAEAVSMPGIDPRTWLSFAIVTAVGHDAEGFFADVTMVPGMVKIPCRVGQSYAGPSFGSSSPVDINDEVVVVIPDGNPANGGVVIACLYSKSDPPPQDALNNPSDLVTVVKPGQNLRIGVSSGGKCFFGQTNATDAAVVGTTYRSNEDTFFSAVSSFASAVSTYVAAIQSTADPVGISSGKMEAACAALQSAVSTFQSKSSSYLSQTVAVGK